MLIIKSETIISLSIWCIYSLMNICNTFYGGLSINVSFKPNGAMTQKYNIIAVASPCDTLPSLPLFKSFKQCWPTFIEFMYFCTCCACILEHNPDINSIHFLKKRAVWSGWLPTFCDWLCTGTIVN